MKNLLNIEPLSFPWQTQDPFIFCVYHKETYPKGTPTMSVSPALLKGKNIGQDFSPNAPWRMYHGTSIPGFPYHPHYGFETITINVEGAVDHTDSMGAAGRFMGGDVQWMTAGKGVQHSEMFPLLHEDKENKLEIFQLWLNLPKASKKVEPHFKMLWREDIPVVSHVDESKRTTTIQVIAGKLNNTVALSPTPDSWAADPTNAVSVFTIKMEPHATWTLPKTVSQAHRSLFFYKGTSLEIEGKQIPSNRYIEARPDVDLTLINGEGEAYLLILEGKPIGEPVVQHGPFVANTPEEIHEVMRDYGNTQFGGWPWPETEVAHAKNKGRFALHSNGKEEIK